MSHPPAAVRGMWPQEGRPPPHGRAQPLFAGLKGKLEQGWVQAGGEWAGGWRQLLNPLPWGLVNSPGWQAWLESVV